MSKTKKMIFLSILVAQALVLYLIERMLPVPFIAPGAKLGLTNIITIVCLYTFNFKDSLTVVIVRLLLSTFIAGTLTSFFYSAAGALLSLIMMYLIMKIGRDQISIIGVSIVGAVFHNIGQILIAALVIQNINIAIYLPVLLIAAIGTGIFVGITSKYLLLALDKINFRKQMKY